MTFIDTLGKIIWSRSSVGIYIYIFIYIYIYLYIYRDPSGTGCVRKGFFAGNLAGNLLKAFSLAINPVILDWYLDQRSNGLGGRSPHDSPSLSHFNSHHSPLPYLSTSKSHITYFLPTFYFEWLSYVIAHFIYENFIY